jgi:hypothetical protein
MLKRDDDDEVFTALGPLFFCKPGEFPEKYEAHHSHDQRRRGGGVALRTGMGPEPGPGVTFLPSRPQSPTHHDDFLTCASK